MLEPNERIGLDMLLQKLNALRQQLNTPWPIEGPVDWQVLSAYLADIKEAAGNLNNDASFVACMLAKQFLVGKHQIKPYDVGAKPQGAAGIDIDVQTTTGERVIGEVKTTEPYGKNDFGGSQSQAIQIDILKLRSEAADYKYFFLTSPRAYRIVTTKYKNETAGIQVILLGATI